MANLVRCTHCGEVYDLGKVTVEARYSDCSVWKCPGCKRTVDDRPAIRGRGDYEVVKDTDEWLEGFDNRWIDPYYFMYGKRHNG